MAPPSRSTKRARSHSSPGRRFLVRGRSLVWDSAHLHPISKWVVRRCRRAERWRGSGPSHPPASTQRTPLLSVMVQEALMQEPLPPASGSPVCLLGALPLLDRTVPAAQEFSAPAPAGAASTASAHQDQRYGAKPPAAEAQPTAYTVWLTVQVLA